MSTNIPMLELDETSYPEWSEGIAAAEVTGAAMPGEPRSYPGYPHWPLNRVKPRLFGSLDRVLAQRRSIRELESTVPPKPILSRLLQMSHGITGSLAAGPVPSAGGLQALELYFVVLHPGWLPSGIYHYDRQGHHVSQLAATVTRDDWERSVPSLGLTQGGGLLWVLVGDGERGARKYGKRAARFLLQEAGHLMQNLCLVSTSLGLVTVPLGGYFEKEIARQLALPKGDLVLYLGLCGKARCSYG